jgi:5-methylcytosine-specific restriction endonuclease McrA
LAVRRAAEHGQCDTLPDKFDRVDICETMARNMAETTAEMRAEELSPTNQRLQALEEKIDEQGRCVKCGSRERLEFDHIIPIAEGGSSTERNIQLLCESCKSGEGRDNLAKADQDAPASLNYKHKGETQGARVTLVANGIKPPYRPLCFPHRQDE